jgi:hypothetical protein
MSTALNSFLSAFDMQFWIIFVLFSAMLIAGAQFLKKILVDAISKSVAEVVKDQWAQMFKKMDDYTNKLVDLENKATLNRKDIDEILEKVRNLK